DLKCTVCKTCRLKKYAYNLSYNKWYFDEIYDGFINMFILPIASLTSAFDKYIVDGFVNFTAVMAKLKGKFLSLFQDGNVQTYAMFMFGGIVFISFMLITLNFVMGY
ncbi:MAG: hypothetical protein PHV68_03765, partial [Candidatus Gastranaerophilales bacterium]|nr:hypothetical protein [Candidatus Gastranaerophilales bacterium]